eukprot:TRINITY_DN2119_c1_g2_i1.p1 TRINITY_DN2119_c1_g2~~TRINITY_DN2119_c1_g2_i1.p1  ORF type:complete len:2648 (+),score=723.64 TRINITY_DN2119_c1_g2_i1:77-8020(+)
MTRLLRGKPVGKRALARQSSAARDSSSSDEDAPGSKRKGSRKRSDRASTAQQRRSRSSQPHGRSMTSSDGQDGTSVSPSGGDDESEWYPEGTGNFQDDTCGDGVRQAYDELCKEDCVRPNPALRAVLAQVDEASMQYPPRPGEIDLEPTHVGISHVRRLATCLFDQGCPVTKISLARSQLPSTVVSEIVRAVSCHGSSLTSLDLSGNPGLSYLAGRELLGLCRRLPGVLEIGVSGTGIHESIQSRIEQQCSFNRAMQSRDLRGRSSTYAWTGAGGGEEDLLAPMRIPRTFLGIYLPPVLVSAAPEDLPYARRLQSALAETDGRLSGALALFEHRRTSRDYQYFAQTCFIDCSVVLVIATPHWARNPQCRAEVAWFGGRPALCVLPSLEAFPPDGGPFEEGGGSSDESQAGRGAQQHTGQAAPPRNYLTQLFGLTSCTAPLPGPADPRSHALRVVRDKATATRQLPPLPAVLAHIPMSSRFHIPLSTPEGASACVDAAGLLCRELGTGQTFALPPPGAVCVRSSWQKLFIVMTQHLRPDNPQHVALYPRLVSRMVSHHKYHPGEPYLPKAREPAKLEAVIEQVLKRQGLGRLLAPRSGPVKGSRKGRKADDGQAAKSPADGQGPEAVSPASPASPSSGPMIVGVDESPGGGLVAAKTGGRSASRRRLDRSGAGALGSFRASGAGGADSPRVSAVGGGSSPSRAGSMSPSGGGVRFAGKRDSEAAGAGGAESASANSRQQQQRPVFFDVDADGRYQLKRGWRRNREQKPALRELQQYHVPHPLRLQLQQTLADAERRVARERASLQRERRTLACKEREMSAKVALISRLRFRADTERAEAAAPLQQVLALLDTTAIRDLRALREPRLTDTTRLCVRAVLITLGLHFHLMPDDGPPPTLEWWWQQGQKAMAAEAQFLYQMSALRAAGLRKRQWRELRSFATDPAFRHDSAEVPHERWEAEALSGARPRGEWAIFARWVHCVLHEWTAHRKFAVAVDELVEDLQDEYEALEQQVEQQRGQVELLQGGVSHLSQSIGELLLRYESVLRGGEAAEEEDDGEDEEPASPTAAGAPMPTAESQAPGGAVGRQVAMAGFQFGQVSRTPGLQLSPAVRLRLVRRSPVLRGVPAAVCRALASGAQMVTLARGADCDQAAVTPDGRLVIVTTGSLAAVPPTWDSDRMSGLFVRDSRLESMAESVAYDARMLPPATPGFGPRSDPRKSAMPVPGSATAFPHPGPPQSAPRPSAMPRASRYAARSSVASMRSIKSRGAQSRAESQGAQSVETVVTGAVAMIRPGQWIGDAAFAAAVLARAAAAEKIDGSPTSAALQGNNRHLSCFSISSGQDTRQRSLFPDWQVEVVGRQRTGVGSFVSSTAVQLQLSLPGAKDSEAGEKLLQSPAPEDERVDTGDASGGTGSPAGSPTYRSGGHSPTGERQGTLLLSPRLSVRRSSQLPSAAVSAAPPAAPVATATADRQTTEELEALERTNTGALTATTADEPLRCVSAGSAGGRPAVVLALPPGAVPVQHRAAVAQTVLQNIAHHRGVARRRQVLQRIPMLRGTSEEVQGGAARAAEDVDFAAHASIIQVGTPAPGLLVVVEGTVRMIDPQQPEEYHEAGVGAFFPTPEEVLQVEAPRRNVVAGPNGCRCARLMRDALETLHTTFAAIRQRLRLDPRAPRRDTRKDQVRAIEPGATPPWSDYNAEFQRLVEQRVTSLRELRRRRQQLERLRDGFLRAAGPLAEMVLSELHTPPEKRLIPATAGGGTNHPLAGGQRYLVNGMLIEVASNKGNLYGGPAGAAKAAKHELRAWAAVLGARCGLSVPLSAMVTYRGYSVRVTAVLPVDGAGSVVYGGSTGPDHAPVDTDAEGAATAKAACAALNLKGHRLPACSRPFYGSADMEIRRGTDRRLYILRPGRLFPPERYAPADHEHGSWLVRLLRPELVAAAPRPLSSDAFSAWGAPEALTDDAAAAAAAQRLSGEALPALASCVAEAFSQRQVLPEGFDGTLQGVTACCRRLCDVAHEHGVNLRRLAALVVLLPVGADAAVRLVHTEIVARAFRSLVSEVMRSLPSPTAEACEREAARLLSLLMGRGAANTELWRDQLYPAARRKFGFTRLEGFFEGLPTLLISSHGVARVEYSGFTAGLAAIKEDPADHIVLLARVCELSGIALHRTAVRAHYERLSQRLEGDPLARSEVGSQISAGSASTARTGARSRARRRGRGGGTIETANTDSIPFHFIDGLFPVTCGLKLPPDDAVTLHCCKGRLDLAEAELTKRIRQLETAFGTEHASIVGPLRELAEVCAQWGTPDKLAEEGAYLRRAADALAADLPFTDESGRERAHTLDEAALTCGLARHCLRGGDFARASHFAHLAVGVTTQLGLGDGHPLSIACLLLGGEADEAQLQHTGAREAYARVCAAAASLGLGPAHPTTAAASLGMATAELGSFLLDDCERRLCELIEVLREQQKEARAGNAAAEQQVEGPAGADAPAVLEILARALMLRHRKEAMREDYTAAIQALREATRALWHWGDTARGPAAQRCVRLMCECAAHIYELLRDNKQTSRAEALVQGVLSRLPLASPLLAKLGLDGVPAVAAALPPGGELPEQALLSALASQSNHQATVLQAYAAAELLALYRRQGRWEELERQLDALQRRGLA